MRSTATLQTEAIWKVEFRIAPFEIWVLIQVLSEIRYLEGVAQLLAVNHGWGKVD